MEKLTLQVGHSPDPDDAFMFYGIAHSLVHTYDIIFKHVIQDIETLNQWALLGRLPVTAISCHAYAYVADKYEILPCGASIGDKYGPIIVSKNNFDLKDLENKTIAVPGKLTTAFLVLSIALQKFTPVFIPFDKIIQAVINGEVDAGLIIHEGQLTYNDCNLEKVIDLGEWWHEISGGLPLPLGLDVVRKDLGKERIGQISEILTSSIKYAIKHKEDALSYAIQFGRGISRTIAEKFVGMYVNDATVTMGEREKEGLGLLLHKAYANKLIPEPVEISF